VTRSSDKAGRPEKHWLEDRAAMLAHAEQIRAQQLTDEQVEQVVQQARSRTKAARTPSCTISASTSTSTQQQQQQQ